MKDIEDEIPFEVPKGWDWCRLGSVYEVNPRVIGEDESLASFIPMEKIEANHANLFTYETDSWKIIKKNHTLFQDGDICFAKISPCFENGKAFIASNLVNGIGAGTTELIVLRNELIEKKYTFYFLGCDSFVKDCCYTFNGVVGQQRISSTFVKNHLFPLPPIEEQKRIVTEIEHSFTLINSLEKDKSDLQTAIKQAKSKILDLAIHGKLVPQDSSDEPASVLLEKLRAEKEAKIKAGELKRDKNDSYIYKNTTDNCYYEKFADGTEEQVEPPAIVPESWVWCHFGDVADVINGKNQSKVEDESGIYPIYGSGGIMGRANDYICPENCTIIGRKGSINNPIFVEEKFWNVDTAFGLAPSTGVLPKYLFYFCKSFNFTSLDSSTTLPSLTKTNIQQILFPLPSLSEQQRILNKVESLFKKLDEIVLNLI